MFEEDFRDFGVWDRSDIDSESVERKPPEENCSPLYDIYFAVSTNASD